MSALWRPATTDFHTRRKLLLALAAAPLAVLLPRLTEAQAISVGDAIAWLHLVGLRSPREQG